jgi:hypothetical protein
LNVTNDFKKSGGSVQFEGLVQYRKNVVDIDVLEISYQTIGEYMNCLNSGFTFTETIIPGSQTAPSVRDQNFNEVPAPWGNVDRKSKGDGQKNQEIYNDFVKTKETRFTLKSMTKKSALKRTMIDCTRLGFE